MRRRVENEFDASAASVREARAFVAATLAAWDIDDVSELALLLTSEVAGNAVRHGRTAYRLAIELRRPEVLFEVRDGSATLPSTLEAGPDAERGRGLTLLETLAAR